MHQLQDLQYPGSWINSRSFGKSPHKVSEVVSTIIEANKDEAMLTSVKHFPGLGNSTIDSHAKLPIIRNAESEIMSRDLVPFQAAIDSGVDMVMVGHVLYPELDNKSPASISNKIQTQLLRQEMNFDGLIITDDMKMGALDKYNQKYSKALAAGSNILLTIETRDNLIKAIEEVSEVDEELLESRFRKLSYAHFEQ